MTKDNNKIGWEIIMFWICIGVICGIVLCAFVVAIGEHNQMGSYDLYNCIYKNAWINNFNQNPIMIDKIQNECICFREHNYTNMLDVDCSNNIIKVEPLDNNITCHSDGCNNICCDRRGTCTTTLMYCPDKLFADGE